MDWLARAFAFTDSRIQLSLRMAMEVGGMQSYKQGLPVMRGISKGLGVEKKGEGTSSVCALCKFSDGETEVGGKRIGIP